MARIDKIPEPMLAEVIPPRVLPRVLTRFDMVAIYFALIFGSYGASQMATQGWAGIPMMLLAAATFLLPCAIASYELGTLFPGEGGIYIWAHKTMGPIHGFIAGWLGWVPIFLLVPLGATTVVAHLQFITGYEWPLWGQVFAQICVVMVVGAISLGRLEFSQGYIRLMFWVSLGTAVVLFGAAICFGKGGTPVDAEILSLNLDKYGTLYSAAILWLLGVEVPFNMGAEFSDHRSTARTMFVWGSGALIAGYLLGIAGILLVTPAGLVDATTGVARAGASIQESLGLILGVAICLAVVSQDVAYMNAYSRLLFISGIEKRLPSVFAQVTERSRVPVPAILLQILGAISVLLIFSTQTNLAVAFNLYLASLVTVWCLSLFYLYLGVLRARSRFCSEYEQRGGEVWRIPGGTIGLWVVVLWGATFNAVAIWYVFATPWTSEIDADGWRMWLLTISSVIVVVGGGIFFGSRERAAAASLEDELRKYARYDAQSSPPSQEQHRVSESGRER